MTKETSRSFNGVIGRIWKVSRGAQWCPEHPLTSGLKTTPVPFFTAGLPQTTWEDSFQSFSQEPEPYPSGMGTGWEGLFLIFRDQCHQCYRLLAPGRSFIPGAARPFSPLQHWCTEDNLGANYLPHEKEVKMFVWTLMQATWA